jgi:AcrR family transcriptional regulator
MQQRAEAQEATRQRIVDAAVEVRSGLRDRTLTAVAVRAGVSRLTVYRHFPDEVALATACMTRFIEIHPPPAPSGWAAIEPPAARLHVGLTELYRWYGQNEGILTNAAVDQFADPAIVEAMLPVTAGFDAMHRVLAAGWPALDGTPMLSAAIDHAMAFTTWLSLRRGQGLDEADAVTLMVRLAETVVSRSPVAAL